MTTKKGKNWDFAERLKAACDRNPEIPEHGKGRQYHVAEILKISQESVRKYFSGESRPKPNKMTALAKIVDADEAWLALGIKPEGVASKTEKRQISAAANGSVYTLFGLLTIRGYTCAFPQSGQATAMADIFAIRGGIQVNVAVTTGRLEGDRIVFNDVPRDYEMVTVVGVIPLDGMKVDVIKIPQDVLDRHGKPANEWIKLALKRDGRKGAYHYMAGDIEMPVMEDLVNI